MRRMRLSPRAMARQVALGDDAAATQVGEGLDDDVAVGVVPPHLEDSVPPMPSRV